MQQKRFLLFAVFVIILLAVWFGLGQLLFPPRPEPTRARESMNLALGLHPSTGPWDAGPGKAPPKEEPPKPVDFGFWDWQRMRLWATAKRPELKPGTRIALGSKASDSKYHLHVVFDSRGAGVNSLLLNKFKATDENGKPKDELLELIPASANERNASNLLFHFSPKDAGDDKPDARPVATLGQMNWKPSTTTPEEEELPDGRTRQSIRFTAEVDGVEITKVYTLTTREYHLGLEVHLRNLGKDGTKKFRYQLTGAKGLPIEGRWYTGVYRNAMIGTVDVKGNVYRDLQDLRQIGVWEGGNAINREEGKFIRYAGIANQYFASAIVVDQEATRADTLVPESERFLTRARPTLETALAKGKIESITEDKRKLVLARTDTIKETFYLDEIGFDVREILKPEMKIALWHRTDPHYRLEGNESRAVAYRIVPEGDQFHPVWEDDITVRVTTQSIELKDDAEVVHRYMLYNGPVKPRLLGYLPPAQGVSREQVDHYENLGLYTMTDHHSPGRIGEFASMIYWTDLIIKCTNLMHFILNWINWLLAMIPWLPTYGLSIVCLTVLVRGTMFPISRKGAMMSIRMQELGPEMKKLQEKYKDDRQQLQLETMALYRKHGVNPFGTCWFMVLQMPIFMGLYFALQESITFRLAPFTYIDNLAAPDMLLPWGESIPFLSRPEDFGGFLYLGPYLNILPIIAVALMIVQQKMMTPPPTDEQQEMQQKMMKYMMVFMGLMFYKVAAGLCIYFIASSLWGFAERKLLPKKKPLTPTDGTTPTTNEGLLSKVLGGRAADTSTAVTEAPGKGKQGRVKKGKDRGPTAKVEVLPEGASAFQRLRAWWRAKRERLSEWWGRVLKEASKKGR